MRAFRSGIFPVALTGSARLFPAIRLRQGPGRGGKAFHAGYADKTTMRPASPRMSRPAP